MNIFSAPTNLARCQPRYRDQRRDDDSRRYDHAQPAFRICRFVFGNLMICCHDRTYAMGGHEFLTRGLGSGELAQ
jgi:hypothetical protein